MGKCITEKFTVNNGLKQGDGISPLLVNVVLDMAANEVNIGLDIFENEKHY